MTRIGSLFSGMGGLDLAAESVLGGSVAWHCETEPSACRVLEHRWPGAPNLGDITTVDWAQVEPADVLVGGPPCQDVSSAGARAGLRPGTRSGLWSHMAHAISVLRPRLVVIENVRGLLSASAHCDVEPCPWCMGDVFSETFPTSGSMRSGVVYAPQTSAPPTAGTASSSQPGLLPTPTARCSEDSQTHRSGARSGELLLTGVALELGRGALLPTPSAGNFNDGESVESWQARKDRELAKGRTGNGIGTPLAIAVQLLPTPTAADRFGPGEHGEGGQDLRTAAARTGATTDPPSSGGR